MFHSIVNDKIHTSKLYPILKAGYKKGIFDTHTHTSGFFVFFDLLCFHSERKKERKENMDSLTQRNLRACLHNLHPLQLQRSPCGSSRPNRLMGRSITLVCTRTVPGDARQTITKGQHCGWHAIQKQKTKLTNNHNSHQYRSIQNKFTMQVSTASHKSVRHLLCPSPSHSTRKKGKKKERRAHTKQRRQRQKTDREEGVTTKQYKQLF